MSNSPIQKKKQKLEKEQELEQELYQELYQEPALKYISIQLKNKIKTIINNVSTSPSVSNTGSVIMRLNTQSRKSVASLNSIEKLKLTSLKEYKQYEPQYLKTMLFTGNSKLIFDLANFYIKDSLSVSNIDNYSRYLYYAFEYYKMYVMINIENSNTTIKSIRDNVIIAIDRIMSYYENYIHTSTIYPPYNYLDLTYPLASKEAGNNKHMIMSLILSYKYIRYFLSKDNSILQEMKNTKTLYINLNEELPRSNCIKAVTFIFNSGKTVLRRSHPPL